MKISTELLYENTASIILHPDIPLAENFSVNKLFDIMQITNHNNALILRILCELYTPVYTPLKEEQSMKERYFSAHTSDVTCDYKLSEKYTVANNE